MAHLLGQLEPPATRKKVHGPSVLDEQAFKPFGVDTGTSYPTTQEELDFHRRSLWLRPNPNKFVSENCATADMMRQNDPKRRVSKAEFEACERLKTLLRNHKAGHPYGPDLAVKAFKDLDLVFFGGHLSGHVTVRWSGCSKIGGFDCDGKGKCCYGFAQNTIRHGSGQCRIFLNADLIFSSGIEDPFKQMMTTLLHEMCHTIDDVRCGIRFQGNEPHEGHHEHFGTRISVVHKLALRLLGWGAVGENEPYMQHHWFKGSNGHGPSYGCGVGSRRDGGGHKDHKSHGGQLGVTRAGQEVDAPMRTKKIDVKTGHKEDHARDDGHKQNFKRDEGQRWGERGEGGQRERDPRDVDRNRREVQKKAGVSDKKDRQGQIREPDKKDDRAECREDRHRQNLEPDKREDRAERRDDRHKHDRNRDEKKLRGERREGGQRYGGNGNEKDDRVKHWVDDQRKR